MRAARTATSSLRIPAGPSAASASPRTPDRRHVGAIRLTTPSSMGYRRAMQWSMASVVWTLLAGGTAIAAGAAAGSLLLIAFGAVGLLDAAGSAVLVVHFRNALHHEAMSANREQLALVAIACGMTMIALGTAVMSIRRLLDETDVDSSPVGIVITTLSIGALAVLARGKQHVATRVNSRALTADAHVSAMGA